MNISRWIYVPLLSALAFAGGIWILFWLAGVTLGFEAIAVWLLAGALLGFLLHGDNARRAHALAAGEAFHELEQRRTVALPAEFRTAFECCRAAVAAVGPAEIVFADAAGGEILARTSRGLDANPDEIRFTLKSVTDILTEVEIRVRPTLKTLLVGNGESWLIAENLARSVRAAADRRLSQRLSAGAPTPARDEAAGTPRDSTRVPVD